MALVVIGNNSAWAVNPASVDFNVNIAPTLTIDVTSGGVATNNITLNLNPNSKTFDHQSVDINVATNNVTGYQLFVSTVDGKTELARDNTDGAFSSTIPTIPTLTPTSPSTTGYSESDFRNCTIADCTNKWGYKVVASDTDPSTVTANYFPFVLNTNLATNHYATNGDNTTLDFAAKIDWAQPAGTYENTLVFTATATYAAYHIDYYDGVDNTNTIATQDNAYNTSSTVVLNPVYSGGATGPTRSGLSGDTYTFIKWCDVIPTADSNNYFPATVCSGNSYDLNGTMTIDPTQYSTNINLYAYWDPTTFDEAYLAAGKTKSGSYYMMQDMDANLCHAVTVNEVTQLTDTRSGNYTYYIAKLKDDKCWMVQNLRLGTDVSSLTLTSSDSNISASSWTLNGKVASPGKFTYTSCATGTCEDRYTGTTQYNNNNEYYCAPDSASSNNYVGCYYNWYTATAGVGLGGNVAGSITPVGTSVGYKDVSSSICPKGWYLPTGGGVPLTGSTSDRPNSDFNVLYNNYPSAADMLVSNPTTTYDNTTGQPRPGLLLSGFYSSGGAYYVAQSGDYWSRSAYSKGMAYRLSLNSSAVYPQNYGSKYVGMSVRCVAYGSS